MKRFVTLRLLSDHRLMEIIETVDEARNIAFLGMTEVRMLIVNKFNVAICLHETPCLQVHRVRGGN